MSSINYTVLDAGQVTSPVTPQAHLITHLSSGAEPTHKKLGILMSIWNLINDVIAAGAVALPFLVASGGVFLTPILMALYCFLCFQSLLLVFELVSRYKVESFPELAQRGLGRAGFVWASTCMFIFNWGGAVGALIAIGTAVPDLMINWFPHSTSFWTTRSGIIIGAMCLFGPLSLFKSMRRFAPLSMIGVWAIFGLAFCIIGRCLLTYTHAVDAWPVPTPPAHAWRFYQSSFFPAIGGISYIFTCHDMSIHVLHSLEDPTRQRWTSVAGGTMLLAFIIASMLALSGYLLFFTDAAGNILDNFAKDDRLVVVCRVLLGVNVLFSIPYSVLMPRVVIQSLIKLPFPHLVEKTDDNRFVRNVVHTIVTVILQVAAVVLALHVTDLGLFYEIVGGMSAICVSLVIPPIIYLSISNTEFEANPISPLLTVGAESNAQPEQSEALTLEAIRQHKSMRFRCYILLALGVVGMAGCLGSIFFNQ